MICLTEQSQEQQKSFKLVNSAPTATALFIAPELAVIDDDGGVEKQIRQTEPKKEGRREGGRSCFLQTQFCSNRLGALALSRRSIKPNFSGVRTAAEFDLP